MGPAGEDSSYQILQLPDLARMAPGFRAAPYLKSWSEYRIIVTVRVPQIYMEMQLFRTAQRFSYFIPTYRFLFDIFKDVDLDMVNSAVPQFVYSEHQSRRVVQSRIRIQQALSALGFEMFQCWRNVFSAVIQPGLLGQTLLWLATCHLTTSGTLNGERDRTERAPHHQEEMQLRQTRSSPSLVGRKPN